MSSNIIYYNYCLTTKLTLDASGAEQQTMETQMLILVYTLYNNNTTPTTVLTQALPTYLQFTAIIVKSFTSILAHTYKNHVWKLREQTRCTLVFVLQ